MKIRVSVVEIFLRDEKGATAVEYVIMASMIAAVIVLIVYFVGLRVKEALNMFCTSFANHGGGACG